MTMMKNLSLILCVAGSASSVAGFSAHPILSLVKSASALNAQKTAVIAGASGYIGKSVVHDAVRQGYKTYALVRDKKACMENQESYGTFFRGAEVVECDVSDAEQLQALMQEITDKSGNNKIEAVVSCLASRTGIKKEAYQIDYQATLNCLNAGRAVDAGHFVMLSAYCVKNPWLQFQQAKLKFEAALQEQDDMTWSIVRPTAFFKSVSAQVNVVRSGRPYMLFGDGQITRCNPISESELATYLMDCATDKSRENKILNLGGPDNGMAMVDQGAMIFKALDMEPKYTNAPVWIFDAVINTFQFLADITGLEKLENGAETGRIAKYYAVESMLTTDPEEKYGKITLQEHYNRIAIEGQQEENVSLFQKARLGKFGNSFGNATLA